MERWGTGLLRLSPLPLLLTGALVTAPVVLTGLAALSPAPEGTTLKGAEHEVELRIAAVGDIMLGGSSEPVLHATGYDYPFVHMRKFLQDSHIVFGNLEGPLTDRGEAVRDKKYVFRSPPEKVVPALQAAGFTVLSLANNHILDYGVEGLEQTMEVLKVAGIHPAGAGRDLAEARRPALVKGGGRTVAFLAYSLTLPESFYAEPDRPGTAFGHEHHVRADVAQARRQADLVIVSFHWGRELETTLRDYQPRLGHAAIDAGASVVFGHHPHILQGIERYKHGVILYSLGNFTFGSYSKSVTRSAIAQLLFRGNRLRQLRMIPINVNNIELNFQPLPLSGRDADAVIEDLHRLSLAQGATLENQAGVGVLVFPDGDQ